MIIYSIIPLLFVIGMLILKKFSFKKIVNGLFWGIISILITSLICILILPLFGFQTFGYDVPLARELSLFNFIVAFFTAALPEELSKLISIRFCSKKEKSDIYINSILVSMTFACVENFMYTTSYGAVGLLRFLQPGHLFFQLIMALFLVKSLNLSGAKKILFNGLAIGLPVLCHTSFNFFNSSADIISYAFCAIGVLTYVFTIIILLKLPISNYEKDIKLFGLKFVFIVLTVLFLISFNSFSDNTKNLNEIQFIQEDNIELKVISSEKVEIDSFLGAGNYIKVKVELKNNNSITYTANNLNIRLIDDLYQNDSYLSVYGFDDQLYQVGAGEKNTGYFYFSDEGYNYKYLIYNSVSNGDYMTYTFDIK